MAGVTIHSPASAPATVVRPSASKNDAAPSGPQPDDFSFYKSVGDKKADSALSAPEKRPTPPAAAVPSEPPKSTDASAPATSGGYFVQVAAVTRKEDADSLVEALNKKQYPAFAASKTNTDKYYRVQVGPYFELKEAETMKARLVADGYNPIVKK